MNFNLITILGPTAVGKTRLAANLANHFNGEIISADSRQVYKYMDIGTGKDYDDYLVDNNFIPYHLIDIVDPKEEFDLFKFNKLFYKHFDEISKRGKIPFLVGGTGLYLDSILNNYDLHKVSFSKERINDLKRFSTEELINKLKSVSTKLHNTTDLIDRERTIKAIIKEESIKEKSILHKPKINSLVIGIKLDREIVKERITNRLKSRLNSGMIEEVKLLIEKGIEHDKLNFFGLEYRYISQYLQGKLNYNDMFQKLNSAIHNFAKRQMTWFRKIERNGIKINWIDGADFHKAKILIEEKFYA